MTISAAASSSIVPLACGARMWIATGGLGPLPGAGATTGKGGTDFGFGGAPPAPDPPGDGGGGELSAAFGLTLNLIVPPSFPVGATGAVEEDRGGGVSIDGAAANVSETGAAAGEGFAKSARGRNLITGTGSANSGKAAGGGGIPSLAKSVDAAGAAVGAVASDANLGFSRKRGASVEPVAAAIDAAGGGAGASAKAAGRRGFSFSDGISSLITVTKTKSPPHETKKIPSRFNSSRATL